MCIRSDMQDDEIEYEGLCRQYGESIVNPYEDCERFFWHYDKLKARREGKAELTWLELKIKKAERKVGIAQDQLDRLKS